VNLTRTTAAVCVLATLLAITGFPHTVFAQTQTEAMSAPLATGMTDGGAAEAQVVEAVRADNILTIKLRFKPLVAASWKGFMTRSARTPIKTASTFSPATRNTCCSRTVMTCL
jgi:hypothetical protein